ncbi:MULTISPECIES: phosphopantothenoylcysteine decarboxylase [Leptospira]|uniref:DNA/pantothenate metabolism flavoprotein n=2 Tax=Leptospira weilii TaxID=28184 RepID=N1U7A4_9LEPT|nr:MULTISPECIES: phosphopantothenoylcysteine decarboxylase [Leptospira]EMY14947.1 DNA/pantothenate metabolism flavoprotein [Leptospira weilii str. Ecochallenge]EMJ60292.1 DNA/pantothenate metabolism flavoprotein [Leptospira sp. P2653]EMN92425.1 DNA/pantothenate metabolism flavoprotein [Leptospira weilii str. UI 13098]MCL8268097.1 phosphopantothenoylcysteine decarboxylase [Leptospira weilii]MDL5246649.1 phosphopantothenoylcysteine decarboxylase [Leptospira weilii]
MGFSKAIITSGPTREWIDPVRYISNASSGKMGFHIAEEIGKWISNVTYVHGLVQEEYKSPVGIKRVSVETTLEMCDIVLSEIQSDTLLVMAAAPADFRPAESKETKIKKEDGRETLLLEFVKNPDILKSVSSKILKDTIRGCCLVGFAAETNSLEEHAIGKLKNKNLDYIVGNYVGKNEKGFGEGETSVIIYSSFGKVAEIGPLPKEVISEKIVEFLKRETSKTFVNL